MDTDFVCSDIWVAYVHWADSGDCMSEIMLVWLVVGAFVVGFLVGLLVGLDYGA